MLVTLVAWLALVPASGLAGAVPTQGDDPAVVTTSTLPTDNRELGNSLPRPGRGMEPQDAGDPGGALQTWLFFLVCGAITLIAFVAWRSSSRARARRTAAGLDPVTVARSRGEGVRGPRTGAGDDPGSAAS